MDLEQDFGHEAFERDERPRIIINLKEYNRLVERDKMLDEEAVWERRARDNAKRMIEELIAKDPSLDELKDEALDWCVKSIQEFGSMSTNTGFLYLAEIGKALFFGRFESIFRESTTGEK